MTARGLALVAVVLLQPQAPDLETVLDLASAYVERYEPALGMLIAEEEYDQRALLSGMAVGAGRASVGDRRQLGGITAVARREYQERRTKSDFLMLRLPSADDQWVGFRVVIDNLESVVDDFARQTFSAQHEKLFYPRVLFPQVVERRRGRGDNALGRNSNAHAFQMLDVIPSAPRRVVGQKGVADADPLEPAEKRKRPVKQGAPTIERAVHVQRNMLDVPQSRGQ